MLQKGLQVIILYGPLRFEDNQSHCFRQYHAILYIFYLRTKNMRLLWKGLTLYKERCKFETYLYNVYHRIRADYRTLFQTTILYCFEILRPKTNTFRNKTVLTTIYYRWSYGFLSNYLCDTVTSDNVRFKKYLNSFFIISYAGNRYIHREKNSLYLYDEGTIVEQNYILQGNYRYMQR